MKEAVLGFLTIQGRDLMAVKEILQVWRVAWGYVERYSD